LNRRTDADDDADVPELRRLRSSLFSFFFIKEIISESSSSSVREEDDFRGKREKKIKILNWAAQGIFHTRRQNSIFLSFFHQEQPKN